MATATLSTETKAYTRTVYDYHEKTVLLTPRPLARYAGCIVLVPLLPKKRPAKPLPAEVWRKVMRIAMADEVVADNGARWRTSAQGSSKRVASKSREWSKWDLTLICKELKAIVLPLLYGSCTISSLSSLSKFTSHLVASDQKWDSIRRIPYSTPGRWVHSLNLAELLLPSRLVCNAADNLLSRVFPLLPYLERLELSLGLELSARAIQALGTRDGAERLRVLRGLKYDNISQDGNTDPLTELVACCVGLEELEIVGPGMDELDVAIAAGGQIPPHHHMFAKNSQFPTPILYLPRLQTLTILSTAASPLLLSLLHSPLPALRTLVLTPYGDLPPPLSMHAALLAVHGPNIRTLVLHTPRTTWPNTAPRFPPPTALLRLLPNLTALSLESASSMPLHGEEGVTPSFMLESPLSGHPLTTLWIPRPSATLQACVFALVPNLPRLREVRALDVRWARRGMSPHALLAGTQGEMHGWARRLETRGVKMLDADGKERGA